MIQSKSKRIEKHLIKTGSISSWTAFTHYNCTRLASVIFRLRQRGWPITTDVVKSETGSTYAQYFLQKDFKQQ